MGIIGKLTYFADLKPPLDKGELLHLLEVIKDQPNRFHPLTTVLYFKVVDIVRFQFFALDIADPMTVVFLLRNG